MTFPNSNNATTTNTIQGVILAEVACTFFLYILLKIIHYLRWGYEDDLAPKEGIDTSQHRCTKGRFITR